MKSLSRVQLLATPWTAAHLAPPSMGFSRQEYQSGLPLPSRNNKNKYIYLECRKNGTDEPMYRAGIDVDVENGLVREGEGGMS